MKDETLFDKVIAVHGAEDSFDLAVECLNWMFSGSRVTHSVTTGEEIAGRIDPE